MNQPNQVCTARRANISVECRPSPCVACDAHHHALFACVPHQSSTGARRRRDAGRARTEFKVHQKESLKHKDANTVTSFGCTSLILAVFTVISVRPMHACTVHMCDEEWRSRTENPNSPYLPSLFLRPVLVSSAVHMDACGISACRKSSDKSASQFSSSSLRVAWDL